MTADILPDDPALRAMLEPDAPASAEIATSRGSDTRTYQVTCSSLKNRRGKSLGRLINLHDISRMKELQDKLEILSVRDSLTGLYNRRYLNEFTTKEIGRTKAIGDDLSVIMLDLDHFKRVNDTWGHAVGDIVLKSVASICLATVREGDVVGRLGGEEILLVLPHTVLDEALDIAERLRTAIEKSEVAFEGQSIRVTASFGAASICTSRSELKDLLIMADLALYRAKEAGRNRVCGNACVDPS